MSTSVLVVQWPPDEAIECLHEARRRSPNLKGVRSALAPSLYACFNWDRSHDYYEEAMSIVDEMIANPNNVELALRL